MKKLLFLFSFLLTTLYASSQEINAMVLHLASGAEVTCLLDERPVVTFEGDELVLTTHMNVVRYQASDVLSFTYASVSITSIDRTSSAVTSFAFDGDMLRANSLAPKSMVMVYTVDGTLVTSCKTDKSGNVSLSLPRQAGAVYVVKTSVANFKISKP